MPNFRFPEDDFSYGRGGPKTKARNNIQAIELLKELETENRSATSQEQETLTQYVGWGGIPQIFNPTPDPDWADLAQQLKTTLEPEEWDSAFESTLNAHYTSPEVITEIYRGLEHLGFRRGNILEPSMGTGNFIGLMPERMAQRSQVTGIELDQITGRIAKQLYPDAELHVRGFEETPLPENYYDLAISNVPFGDYKVKDPEYNHLDLQIHNYFFARSLDRVRPGGLVTFITSTGTLQSKSNQKFREWLAERSNLVGAMRLPGSAFKQTAGTEVTTDLIILQKHGPTVAPIQQPWTNLADTTAQDAEGNYLQTNEYYAQHPERMLGELCDDKLYPGRLALRSDGKDLGQAMADTFASFPAGIYQSSAIRDNSDETVREPLPEGSTLKNYGYLAQGEQIWQRTGNWVNLTDFKGKRAERISGMLDIRDAVQDVFAIQIRSGTDAELETAQAKLNQVYDQFTGKHGLLSATANSRVFKLDPDAQLLLALEQINKDTNQIEKAAVFSKRTVRSTITKDTAETSQEALLTSLNEYGSVVPSYMARLLNQDESAILADLKDQGLIFKDPDSQEWQTQDQYLSGNVRQKLRDAEQAAEDNPEFAANVAALEEIQPRDLGPGEIEVRLGAPWVPTEVIRDFAQELLEVPEGISVDHSTRLATWAVNATPTVKSTANNQTTYGTNDLTALDLLESSLNLKDATVYGTDADGKRYVKQDATLSAKMKQQQIQERFKGWIWQDFNRSEQLCDRYNNLFNDKVARQFSNPNLEMPGSNPAIELRSHQKDGVWRILQSDTTLLAHQVGAGKTFTMVASAIEMRRLGIAKKPMIVVPNHMLGQFTRELQQLYPNAKVLVSTENDSKASKRKELMARIATGDWDAVIVTHSAFTRLPISKAQEQEFYKAQLNELDQLLGIKPGEQNSNAVTKMLARERKKVKARIDTISQLDMKDNGIEFDELGVDALIVDEAHFWKNLGRNSKLNNIAGLSNTSSQRAQDAFMKCNLVRRNGGKLVFATGTPVSNSIAELYTMQRFLQPESLERQGIANFDGWVAAFAEKVTAPEIDPTGRFKVKTRLTRFTNVPELMTLFRETADIQTQEQLNLPVPQVEKITVACEASNPQLQYMEHLIERAEAVQNRTVEPDQDNMLWITTDGRRASLDLRLINAALPDPPRGKVNQAIANIHEIWQETGENKLTQMVFCDLGTPKKSDPDRFSIYDSIKAGLVAKGIPAEEIAFIHDAPKTKDKETLFAAVREGKVRVLIGSTEKCGVGMNVQDRLIAEHHIDPPWRPSDIEQREGRILRQGNRNEKVMVLTYVTQGRDGQLGFDSYSWQTLARKAEMVSQVMNGDSSLRSVDDVSSSALSFDEIKAIATGNPLIMEKASVDNRVSEISRYRQAFMNDRYVAQRRITTILPADIKRLTKKIDGLAEDINRKQDTRGDRFRITLGERTLDQREPAGQILQAALAVSEKNAKRETQKIGEFAGFAVVVNSNLYTPQLELRSPSGQIHEVRGGNTAKGIIRSMENTPTKLPEFLESARAKLGQKQNELQALLAGKDKPFEYEAELEEMIARQQEINTELGLYKDDDQAAAAEAGENENEAPEPTEAVDPDDEKPEELVDLDSLTSADSDLSWLDGVEEAESNEPCLPTSEVLEALQNLGAYHDPDAEETEIATEVISETAVDPGMEEIAISPETIAETSIAGEAKAPDVDVQSPEVLQSQPKTQPRENTWQPFSNGEQLGLFSTATDVSPTPETPEIANTAEPTEERQTPSEPTRAIPEQLEVTTPATPKAQPTPVTPTQQPTPQPKAPPAETITPQSWPKIAAAIGKPQQYQTWVQQQLGGGQLSRMGDRAFKQDVADYQATLKQVRTWYASAKRLHRPETHLDRISDIGQGFKVGQPLTTEALTEMKTDFNQLRYQQLTKSLPPGAQSSIPQLAAEAFKLGYIPKQVMGILSVNPRMQEIRKTRGEQESLKACRQFMLEGTKLYKAMQPRQTSQIGQHHSSKRGR